MLAVACGLGAAVVFATVTLCNARSSRLIGPRALLGWIMAVGLAILAPLIVLGGRPPELDAASLGWMAVAGAGDVVGLLLAYAGLAAGKVGVVAPIVSTQGAVAATIAVLAGEPLVAGAATVLAAIVVGVVLAAAGRDPEPDGAARRPGRSVACAVGAAASLGASLYAIAQVSIALPVVWALLPSRLLGVLVVTLPLLLRSRLTMTSEALPLVLVAGAGEVAGFALFGLGSRYGIAVTAVLASLFAALAAIAARVLFGERLRRVQVVGVAVVVASVALLSALRA